MTDDASAGGPDAAFLVISSLLALSLFLFAVSAVPGRALAAASPRLAAHRSDLAFGAFLVVGALALGYLVSLAS